MWTKTYSVTTTKATKEQMWKLFANVNQWHTWDKGIEFATMEGNFEKGNHFILKPKGGPKVKIQLIEAIKNKKFVDQTTFTLAKMHGEHLFEDCEGGIKITTTMKVSGILSFLWVKLVAKGIADAIPEEMEEQINTASKL